MKALEDAKAAWDDALATFRKAAGLITILATFPVLGAQLVG
jgi:hypothetical protein